MPKEQLAQRFISSPVVSMMFSVATFVAGKSGKLPTFATIISYVLERNLRNSLLLPVGQEMHSISTVVGTTKTWAGV
jgi:hypothetical protein